VLNKNNYLNVKKFLKKLGIGGLGIED